MIERTEQPRLLLTAIEAARALAISTRKLWSMTASGQIVATRLGRSVRYHIRDLERAIEAAKEVRHDRAS